MENWIIYTIVSVTSVIIGMIIGVLSFKIKAWLEQKKILKNAREILKGERKNEIEIEGKTYSANKFRVRTDDGKELIIDLKGGGKAEYAKEKIIKKTGQGSKGFKMEPYNRAFNEDSGGVREEKRDTRTRNDRIRRYG